MCIDVSASLDVDMLGSRAGNRSNRGTNIGRYGL
jgi:hypothetical protein